MNYKNENDLLLEAKRIVLILDYIRGQGFMIKGDSDKVLINPCPVCNRKNHFYIYKNTNTFYSYSNCCRGGSIIDFMNQVEGLNIKESVKKVLEISGLKGNKKSVSEVNTLKNKIFISKEKEQQDIETFNNIYNTICSGFKQLKTEKTQHEDNYKQFLIGFYERILDKCFVRNEKNFNLLLNLKNEFLMCLTEWRKIEEHITKQRSEFDV